MNSEKNFARFIALFFNNLHEYPADQFDPEILYRNGDVPGARIYFSEILKIVRKNAYAEVLIQDSLFELETIKLWEMYSQQDIDSMVSKIEALIPQCYPITPGKFDLLEMFVEGLKSLEQKSA